MSKDWEMARRPPESGKRPILRTLLRTARASRPDAVQGGPELDDFGPACDYVAPVNGHDEPSPEGSRAVSDSKPPGLPAVRRLPPGHVRFPARVSREDA